jgi:hypothetical protein
VHQISVLSENLKNYCVSFAVKTLVDFLADCEGFFAEHNGRSITHFTKPPRGTQKEHGKVPGENLKIHRRSFIDYLVNVLFQAKNSVPVFLKGNYNL